VSRQARLERQYAALQARLDAAPDDLAMLLALACEGLAIPTVRRRRRQMLDALRTAVDDAVAADPTVLPTLPPWTLAKLVLIGEMRAGDEAVAKYVAQLKKVMAQIETRRGPSAISASSSPR
jgi:hypothetical protein